MNVLRVMVMGDAMGPLYPTSYHPLLEGETLLDPALSARWAITNCMDGWYLVCSTYRVGTVGVARHLQNPFKYVLPAQPRGPGGV